jgi:transcriptional regulator with XRE-family HTH domain
MKDVDADSQDLDQKLQVANNFFGRGIKFLRKKHNITQQELEWYSGVQQNVISMMESGKANFKMEHVVRIAAAFNMNIVTFFDVCLVAS